MLPGADHTDFAARTSRARRSSGSGANGPEGASIRRPIGACSPAAAATRPSSCTPPPAIGPEPAASERARPRARRGGADRNAPDFTTAQRLDQPIPPGGHGSDAFFEFLFSRAPIALRRAEAHGRGSRAAAVVPARRRDDDLQHRRRLQVVRTQLTQNVVGHRRGQRSGAEGHVCGVRRPLRSRRLRRAEIATTATGGPARRAA